MGYRILFLTTIFILWEKDHNLFIPQSLRVESCLTAKPVYILKDKKVF